MIAIFFIIFVPLVIQFSTKTVNGDSDNKNSYCNFKGDVGVSGRHCPSKGGNFLCVEEKTGCEAISCGETMLLCNPPKVESITINILNKARNEALPNETTITVSNPKPPDDRSVRELYYDKEREFIAQCCVGDCTHTDGCECTFNKDFTQRGFEDVYIKTNLTDAYDIKSEKSFEKLLKEAVQFWRTSTEYYALQDLVIKVGCGMRATNIDITNRVYNLRLLCAYGLIDNAGKHAKPCLESETSKKYKNLCQVAKNSTGADFHIPFPITNNGTEIINNDPKNKHCPKKVLPPQPAAKTTTPPKTKAPKTKAPKTKAPKTKAPLKTTTPKGKAPKTKAPKTKAPKTKAPKTKAPLKTTTPKGKAPTTKAPPKTKAPSKTTTPKGKAPTTTERKTTTTKSKPPTTLPTTTKLPSTRRTRRPTSTSLKLTTLNSTTPKQIKTTMPPTTTDDIFNLIPRRRTRKTRTGHYFTFINYKDPHRYVTPLFSIANINTSNVSLVTLFVFCLVKYVNL